jgi:hypothetical protein
MNIGSNYERLSFRRCPGASLETESCPAVRWRSIQSSGVKGRLSIRPSEIHFQKSLTVAAKINGGLNCSVELELEGGICTPSEKLIGNSEGRTALHWSPHSLTICDGRPKSAQADPGSRRAGGSARPRGCRALRATPAWAAALARLAATIEAIRASGRLQLPAVPSAPLRPRPRRSPFPRPNPQMLLRPRRPILARLSLRPRKHRLPPHRLLHCPLRPPASLP